MKKSILLLLPFCLLFLHSCKSDTSSCSSVSGYEVVNMESALDDTPEKYLTVKCPKEKRALGAGWSVEDSTSAILDGSATYFQPSYDGTSWLVIAKKNSQFARNWKLRVRCICADVCPDKAFKEYRRPNIDTGK